MTSYLLSIVIDPTAVRKENLNDNKYRTCKIHVAA